MSDGQTWRARAAEHWAKARRAADHQDAYIHLLLAADCFAHAVRAESGHAADKADQREKCPDSNADHAC